MEGRDQHSGTGITINISSSGVLFATGAGIQPAAGSRAELEITWPARGDGRIALVLTVRGRVVRTEAGKIAIEIGRYEFKAGRE